MMADIDNAFRTGYTLRIGWWVNSQDIAGNYSNITAVVYLISTGSSYNINASATKYGSLYIDGSTYNFTFNASLSGGQTKELFRKTVNIYHWGDGTRTFNMYATAGINVTLSGTYWGTVRVPSSGESTCSLTTIPRRSTIVSITGDWIGSDMTVTIDKKSSSFTTSVYVKASNSDWICTVWKKAGTSFTFTLPVYLLDSLPQSTECTGLVKVRTYNGDTILGDEDWEKWMGVPEWVVPTISEVHNGTNAQVNGRWIYIKSKSQMNVRTTASSSYGAWITDIRVDYDGVQYWGGDIWTNIQNVAGDRPLVVHVWDSRGRYSSWSGSVHVHDYGDPWGFINAYRCDADGSRNDVGGTYVKVIYSGDRYVLDGSNTFGLTINHRVSRDSWGSTDDLVTGDAGSGEIILDNNGELFSLEKTYEIRLRVSDWYTYVDYIVPISTAFVLMDFKAGGKGIGIGRVATEDNVAQFATEVQIYAGRDNNPNIGADLTFCNVASTSQKIGICGGPPASDRLLNIYRFTDDPKTLMSFDVNNKCYFDVNHMFMSNAISFLGGSERTIRFEGSPNYMFFHNPAGGNSDGNIGCWSSTYGTIWEFHQSSGQLILKTGYGTSDERLKYDIDEFSNWEDFYNFYMSLKPKTFRYNDDMRNEMHIGLMAQEVGDSIVENNLNNEKLCLVKAIANDNMEDGREYNIAYQELIALNIKMIQKHEQEIQALNDIIQQLKKELNEE